jgi:hypothetical protein
MDKIAPKCIFLRTNMSHQAKNIPERALGLTQGASEKFLGDASF